MKLKVIYPGSFDPFTNGHYDLVKRASVLFDEVIIVVATNTNKISLFTTGEKIFLIKEAIKEFKNVKVVSMPKSLIVDVANKFNANAILRGVRDVKDFEYEKSIAQMNKHLNYKLETIFLFTNLRYSYLSSSMIKEVARFGGNLNELLPKNIAEALVEKIK